MTQPYGHHDSPDSSWDGRQGSWNQPQSGAHPTGGTGQFPYNAPPAYPAQYQVTPPVRRRTPLKVVGVVVAAAGLLGVGVLVGAAAASSGSTSPSTASATSRAYSAAGSLPVSRAPITTTPAAPSDSFGPGTYEVGNAADQIAPGKYKSPGPTGYGCYFARLSSNEGGVHDIIDNDISQGPSLLTVKPTDAFVKISGCTFTKAS